MLQQYQVRKGFKVSIERPDGTRFEAIGGQIIELEEFEAAQNESILEETIMQPNFRVVSGNLLFSNQWFSEGQKLFIPLEYGEQLMSEENKRYKTPRFKLEAIAAPTTPNSPSKKGNESNA